MTASERAQRSLAHRGIFREALTWMEIHGDSPEVVEHWMGILDEGGEFIYPNELISMLFDYLIESRGWPGGAARSLATTHLIDRVARLHKREVLETPVGFNYIGEYIKEGRIVIGGEESAGLSIRGHVPEKDGILACLLITEMLASRRKSLKNQLKDLFSRVGELYNRRLNVKLDPRSALE